uniref:Uncharacterized protein n=1 Tax=Oryza barthii TaxID=65489 RepID=A0A0D3GYT7_9ORYZ
MEAEDKSSGAARALEITDLSDIHRNVMATMWFSSGSIATATIMVHKQIEWSTRGGHDVSTYGNTT